LQNEAAGKKAILEKRPRREFGNSLGKEKYGLEVTDDRGAMSGQFLGERHAARRIKGGDGIGRKMRFHPRKRKEAG